MIYWLTRLDGVCEFFTFVAIFSGIATVLSVGGYLAAKADREDSAVTFTISLMKVVIPIFIIGIIISLFLPTSKEMAAIYLLPKIANNENVKAVPNKSMEILNLKLDEWIDDMRKVNKNK